MSESCLWYNIRVDEEKDADGSYTGRTKQLLLHFKDKLFQKCDKMLITQEIAKKTEKLHYHATFKFRELTKYDTFFKRVKRFFPDYPKGSISCAKVKKPVENIHYLCKDGTIVYAKGFDKEKILRESKEYNEKLYAKKNIINILYELAKESQHKEEVVEVVFNYYLDNGMMMDYRIMKTRVNTVWARVNRESAMKEFMRVCCY